MLNRFLFIIRTIYSFFCWFFFSFQQRQMSYDPTEYVQRARVSKAAPPKPAANPLQFVQMKPCNLYQSAQEHLKRVEEVKKVKEVIKEEPEDWQSVSNLSSSLSKKEIAMYIYVSPSSFSLLMNHFSYEFTKKLQLYSFW